MNTGVPKDEVREETYLVIMQGPDEHLFMPVNVDGVEVFFSTVSQIVARFATWDEKKQMWMLKKKDNQQAFQSVVMDENDQFYVDGQYVFRVRGTLSIYYIPGTEYHRSFESGRGLHVEVFFSKQYPKTGIDGYPHPLRRVPADFPDDGSDSSEGDDAD
jgi:hypothetical protein